MQQDKLADKCIDCGRCTEKCGFLHKHDINLMEFEDAGEELAYNCFLCGKCRRDCPAGIDGRMISLEARKETVNKGRFSAKNYLLTILEKKDYIFRNYKSGKKKTVLFPGCNFPSFYPETTKKLIRELKRTADIGVVFDCCGKPVYELGMTEAGDRIVSSIEKRLAEMGVEEIVTLCPNCYYFLKGRLKVRITDIYTKLHELGIEGSLDVRGLNVFIPCPDRDERLILNSIKPYLGSSVIVEIDDVQCCGLGGHGGVKEPELSRTFIDKLRSKQLDSVYTYCATCCGNFSRNGIEGVKHILCEIISSGEVPAKGLSSLLNRARFRWFV